MGLIERIKLEKMWNKMTEEHEEIIKQLDRMKKDMEYLITMNELQQAEIEELQDKLIK